MSGYVTPSNFSLLSLSAGSPGYHDPCHYIVLRQLLRLHPSAIQDQTGRAIHFNSHYPDIGMYVKHI